MTTVAWQRIEGGLVFAAAILIAALTGSVGRDLPWWQAIALFFAPDVAFAAYLGGPRIGTTVYNLLHLYGWGLLLAGFGVAFAAGPLVFAGLLWLAHVGFDRMLGYGLKEPTGFQDTHLGRIGRR
ncbi:MAG: DUF4260 domain-containing protein [Paracoccaceae bacterium]|nr:MAG: DUF4260 domain-containing protein [Paracoccaceae bacterium]